jgi:hypothetical protein
MAGGSRPWELYDLNVSRESRTSKGRVGPSKAGVNLWGVVETVFLIVCMQPREVASHQIRVRRC